MKTGAPGSIVRSGSILDPVAYEAWYETPRGQWIGEREFILLQHLLKPEADASLLDVGCGTGHFSRRFAQHGQSVTGIDPDPKVIDFAKEQNGGITYLQGNALDLPFPDNSYDYTIAVTSLCFIDEPLLALNEMWRVTRHTLVLGLLNRHSLLYLKKRGHGSYLNARWDTAKEIVDGWLPELSTAPTEVSLRTAIFFPDGTWFARLAEQWIPARLPVGGFLAICLVKNS